VVAFLQRMLRFEDFIVTIGLRALSAEHLVEWFDTSGPDISDKAFWVLKTPKNFSSFAAFISRKLRSWPVAVQARRECGLDS
jgi:hypothetical protein